MPTRQRPTPPSATLGDRPHLGPVLAALRPGPAQAHGALTVVPLLDGAFPDPGWLLLDEALATGQLAVTEVSAAGVVPTLRVTNAGPGAVLLLEGEELLGAKQNRILDASILIAAGRTLEIPVSCVEQGRWAARSKRFTASGRSLYASVRRMKTAHLHETLRREGSRRSPQARVWADLEAKAEQHQVASPTGAMHEVYERRRPDLDAARTACPALPAQAGALVYGAGAWWGLELLATPRLFARAWPRLLSGYAMDALLAEPAGPSAASPPEPPAARLAAIRLGPVETYPAVGEGEEHRFRADTVVGAALVAAGRLAHLVAFPA